MKYLLYFIIKYFLIIIYIKSFSFIDSYLSLNFISILLTNFLIMKKTLNSLVMGLRKTPIFIFGFLFCCFVCFQIISCSKDTIEQQFKAGFNLVDKVPIDPINVKPVESLKFGVKGYDTKRKGDSLDITINSDPGVKGICNEHILLYFEGNSDCILYNNDKNERLLLQWDRKVTGTIVFHAQDKEYIITPKPEQKKWYFVKGSEDEFRSYLPILNKICSISSDFNQAFFRPFIPESLGGPRGSITTIGGLSKSVFCKSEGGSNCGGEMFSLNPFIWDSIWWGFTRTLCCYGAEQQIHTACSNEFCIGCCWVACDFTGFGDILGWCMATARACDSYE